jgi:hypothetical protein
MNTAKRIAWICMVVAPLLGLVSLAYADDQCNDTEDDTVCCNSTTSCFGHCIGNSSCVDATFDGRLGCSRGGGECCDRPYASGVADWEPCGGGAFHPLANSELADMWFFSASSCSKR